MTSFTYAMVEVDDLHGLGCRCCRLQDGFDLPIPAKLSLEEIKEYSRIFSASVLFDWVTLNGLIKRYEGVIIKRWAKKSNEKRREILLKADPDMPTMHRPDFLSFRKLGKNMHALRSRTCRSNAFLWPYINLEDLQKGHNVPMFLNARGRTFPERFAASDTERAHLGTGWAAIAEEAEMVMTLQGRTPQTYGKLVTYEVGKVKDLNHTLPPILGLLALEIQEHNYSFLVKVAKLILHDISPNQLYLTPPQPEPQFPASSSTEWPSLTSHMLEANYLAPQSLDLERLKMLVGARRAVTEEHIWNLRENPGYFLDTLQDYREHNETALNDRKCIDHWSYVAFDVFDDAFKMLRYWSFIHQCLETLPSIKEQIRCADHKTLHLAPQDEQIWLEIQMMTEAMIKEPIYSMAFGFHVSPRMRHCFHTTQEVGVRKTLWETKRKLNAAEYRVEILFDSLTKTYVRELHTLPKLVNEFQDMLEKDAEASALVDSYLLNYFSDVATMSHVTTSITNLRPWYQNMHTSEAAIPAKNAVDAEIEGAVAFSDAIELLFDDKVKILDILGDPEDGSFDYPELKRQTAANVEQMRDAEAKLDKLWGWMDSFAHKHSLQCAEMILHTQLQAPRKLNRTPEWVEPEAKAKAKAKNVPAAKIAGDATARPDHFAASLDRKENVKPAAEKVKEKRRGSPLPPITHDAAAPPAPLPTPAAPLAKVPIPRRAWKVFAALLPDSGAANHQRVEVGWEEFLSAMNVVGLAPEKLYGSVWVFTPKAAGATLLPLPRSIQFHEPKEIRRGGKMSAFIVKAFGRRLKHAFGWEDGMFVCA